MNVENTLQSEEAQLQFGFYFDQTRCSGCFTCAIACKEWHDTDLGPVDYRDVFYIEKGKYPRPYVAYLTISCLHCANPECANACPVNAITKRAKDGIVVVDRDLCLGNGKCPCFCKEACPYDMPRFGEEDNAKMQMCDLCVDRLGEQKSPVCVDACPCRALQVGPLSQIAAEYGQVQEAEGFELSKKTKPSIVFRPKIK